MQKIAKKIAYSTSLSIFLTYKRTRIKQGVKFDFVLHYLTKQLIYIEIGHEGVMYYNLAWQIQTVFAEP